MQERTSLSGVELLKYVVFLSVEKDEVNHPVYRRRAFDSEHVEGDLDDVYDVIAALE